MIRLYFAPRTRSVPDRHAFPQWLHFAESTAFPPLGIIVWLSRYRSVEQALGNRAHLLGDEFSAADIMMGFTLVAARMFGLIDERLPKLQAYLGRLETRPAFPKAASAS